MGVLRKEKVYEVTFSRNGESESIRDTVGFVLGITSLRFPKFPNALSGTVVIVEIQRTQMIGFF